jgi:MFS family permease
LPKRLVKGSPRPLIVFLFAAVMVGFCYRGVMTFLPIYFSQNLQGGIFIGGDVLKGGAFATITLLVGIVGQFVGGHLASRFSLEKLYATMLLITVPLLVAVSATSNYALFFATMVFAFFYFCTQPVGNNLVAEYTDPAGRGLGYGLYFAIAFGLGSFAAGFCGRIATRFGINKVFLVLAGVIFLGFLAMLYVTRLRKSDSAELDA